MPGMVVRPAYCMADEPVTRTSHGGCWAARAGVPPSAAIVTTSRSVLRARTRHIYPAQRPGSNCPVRPRTALGLLPARDRVVHDGDDRPRVRDAAEGEVGVVGARGVEVDGADAQQSLQRSLGRVDVLHALEARVLLAAGEQAAADVEPLVGDAVLRADALEQPDDHHDHEDPQRDADAGAGARDQGDDDAHEHGQHHALDVEGQDRAPVGMALVQRGLGGLDARGFHLRQAYPQLVPSSVVRVEPITTARVLRGPFDYRRPEGVGVGSRLIVPFGRRDVLGIVTALAEASEHELADPRRVIEPSLPPELVDLAFWMAAEYCSTPARALSLMMPPPGMRAKTALFARTADGADLDAERLNDRQRELLASLPRFTGPDTAALRRLEARGLVDIAPRVVRRVPLHV